MSRMLTLIQAGWSSIRFLAAKGRRKDALARLAHLLSRRDVPTPIAADAHRLAGEIFTGAENYTKARRHLRAAAALEPLHARTRYLWALTHERDPLGSDQRALRGYRCAARLEPKNALYRACLGRAAVRCNRLKSGVRELVAAVEMAPDNLNVLRVVVDGLLAADRPGTARRILNRVGFLHRGVVPARELGNLSERVRFAAARRDQRGERGTTRHGQEAEFATEGGRVVLPFIRVAATAPTSSGEHTRRDIISLPRPHFPRLLSRKADR